MIDKLVLLQVGETQVRSELEVDMRAGEVTIIWVHSSCAGATDKNAITIEHSSGFDEQQLADLVAAERWRHAERVAAKSTIRAAVPGMIVEAEGEIKVLTKE